MIKRKTHEYEFSNGETLPVVPFPSFITEKIREANPAPECKFLTKEKTPSDIDPETGEPIFKDVPDLAHPEYVALLQKHNSEVSEKIDREALLYSIKFEVDAERLAELKEIDAELERLASAVRIDFNASQAELKWQYIKFQLLPDNWALNLFWSFLASLNVRREGIEAAKQNFPGTLQG